MKKTRPRLTISAVVGVMLVALLVVGAYVGPGLCAEKPIKLTYGTLFPPTTHYSLAFLSWADKINKETNGRVEVVPYWGGTVIGLKESLSELIAGKVDTAHVTWSYSPGFDVLKKLRCFMYGITGFEIQHRIYDELNSKYPEMEAEFSGAKILERSGMTPFHLFTAKKAVRTLDDLKGLSVKAQPFMMPVLKLLGAEGVNVSMGETYMAIQKGIIDGVISDWAGVASFNFHEVCQYSTVLNFTLAVGPWEFMNWESYRRLPPDIQKVIDANIVFWGSEFERISLELQKKGMKLAEEKGREIIELSSTETDQFFDVCKKVALEEAAKLDALGYHGTQIFNDTRNLFEKYK